MKKYQATLNLPKTDFPMRANLREKEPSLLAQWKKTGLYTQILQKRQGAKKYILHDGPPYANGPIHIGHALNKILKDIVVKSKTMEGYLSPYVPGWDCHGLPIEHQVLKNLGPKREGMSQLQIRKLCRDYAEKFIEIQKTEFIRLGVLGDWENPYKTLTPDYEAAIVREFGKVVAEGAVYKGLKPVLWCMHDETALAEAEVEYQDHTSPSIYVKFPLRERRDASLFELYAPMGIADTPQTRQIKGENLSIIIWTTTPWTLVANRAICLHPDFNYVVLIFGNEAVIVSELLLGPFIKETGLDHGAIQIVCTFKGSQIEGWAFQHPWLDQPSPVILGHHVTQEGGTGCVHTAPGHGREDYDVGLKYGIRPYAPVDGKGRFTQEAESFAGLPVFEANPKIIALLEEAGMLLSEKKIVHSYPHCWRCKQPVIFRATEQWFISMEKTKLQKRALAEIDRVHWIPKWGKDRIIGAVGTRTDWCISRQRSWGVPIVAFSCRACKTPLLSKEIIDSIATRMEQDPKGSDLWFEKSQVLLPEGTACVKCGESEFDQENDILDVWFESGVSHAAVLKRRPDLNWPADLYLEGSDQHRGWFQSTLLASLETDRKAAFAAVLTHGFTVDGEGKKMSKSAGNVVAPQEVVNQYGAEILRLWVAATDFREDIRLSESILKQWVEAYRKIRNTCRFLLSNLYDYTEQGDGGHLLEVDQWALYQLDLVNKKIRAAYNQMDFHTVFHTLNQFCSVDLSAFYLDIIKDRLYASAADDPKRRAAQSVLHEILITLTKLMAPILSFTAEEIWQSIPAHLKGENASIHLTTFPKIRERHNDIAESWEGLITLRESVSKALEEKRTEKIIGTSLEAKVTIDTPSKEFQLLKRHEAFLPTFFIVSQVTLTESQEATAFNIIVAPAEGAKCERCWIFSKTVGNDLVHPTLCQRCCEVITRVA